MSFTDPFSGDCCPLLKTLKKNISSKQDGKSNLADGASCQTFAKNPLLFVCRLIDNLLDLLEQGWCTERWSDSTACGTIPPVVEHGCFHVFCSPPKSARARPCLASKHGHVLRDVERPRLLGELPAGALWAPCAH